MLRFDLWLKARNLTLEQWNDHRRVWARKFINDNKQLFDKLAEN